MPTLSSISNITATSVDFNGTAPSNFNKSSSTIKFQASTQGGSFFRNGIAVNQTTSGFTANATFSGKTLTGLSNNSTYYFRIEHTLGGSRTYSSILGPETTLTGVTPAPGTPSITDIQDTQISISWVAVSGATSYKVYCGTSSNPTTLDGTTTNNTYTKTGLTANTTYYFRLKATNASGDSGYSGQRQALSMVVDPSAPTVVQTNPITNTISWSEVTGTENTQVFGGETSNPTTKLVTEDVGTTSYQHTNLTPGTTYYYRIRQTNDTSETYTSNYSSEVNVTAMSLTAPTNVAGTPAVLNNTITFTEPTYSTRTYIYWSTSSGGTYASVYYAPTGLADGVTSFTANTYDRGQSGGDLLPLENDVIYIKLKAYYEGHYSDYSSAYAAYSLPPVPTNLAVAANNQSELDLTWTAATGDGALPVNYTIARSTSEAGSYSDIVTGLSATSYTDTELDGDTTYYYKIKSNTFLAGSSAFSSAANATTMTYTGPNPTNESLEMRLLGVLTGDASAGAQIDLGTASGGTSQVSLSDFFVSGFSGISGTTVIFGNGATNTFNAVFANAGTQFLTQVTSGHFSWSITSGDASITSTSGRSCTVRNDASSTGGATLQCVYTPSFNDHVTTNLTRTLSLTLVII